MVSLQSGGAIANVQDHSQRLNDFLTACATGDVNQIRELLAGLADEKSKRALLFKKSKDGSTFLMVAASGGHVNAVKELLAASPYKTEKNEFILHKNKHGVNALMHAATGGHLETMKQLLAGLAQSRSIPKMQPDGWTSLIIRSERETKRAEETAKQIFISEKDERGRTSLMYAAQGASANPVQTLLASLPNEQARKTLLLEKDNDGVTALMVAARRASANVVKALLAGMPNARDRAKLLFEEDKLGMTALTFAAHRADADTVEALLAALPNEDDKQKLLSQKNKKGMTALMIATPRGIANLTKLLGEPAGKQSNADLARMSGPEASSPLGEVSGLADGPLSALPSKAPRHPMRVNAGPSQARASSAVLLAPNPTQPAQPEQPLQSGIIQAERTIQPQLIQGTQDFSEELHRAIREGDLPHLGELLGPLGAEERVQALLARDAASCTALMVAAQIGDVHVIEALLANLESAHVKTIMLATTLASSTMRTTHERGFPGGHTALMFAAGKNRANVITLLLDRLGSYKDRVEIIFASNGYGQTALRHAASRSHIEAIDAMLERLDQADVDEAISGRARYGITALTSPDAADDGSVILHLVNRLSPRKRADAIVARTTNGESALAIVAKKGDVRLFSQLLEMLTPAQIEKALHANTRQYETIVMQVAKLGHVDVLRVILGALNETSAKNAVLHYRHDNHSALSLAAGASESAVRVIVERFGPENQHQLIHTRLRSHRTLYVTVSQRQSWTALKDYFDGILSGQ
ncbi:MAG: ankyrin repeat domain-containing protein [Comamonadaceae bacterium]|nr:ankyrin repeat domain-containing protein [Comamonadaceae bacterium]